MSGLSIAVPEEDKDDGKTSITVVVHEGEEKIEPLPLHFLHWHSREKKERKEYTVEDFQRVARELTKEFPFYPVDEIAQRETRYGYDLKRRFLHQTAFLLRTMLDPENGTTLGGLDFSGAHKSAQKHLQRYNRYCEQLTELKLQPACWSIHDLKQRLGQPVQWLEKYTGVINTGTLVVIAPGNDKFYVAIAIESPRPVGCFLLHPRRGVPGGPSEFDDDLGYGAIAQASDWERHPFCILVARWLLVV